MIAFSRHRSTCGALIVGVVLQLGAASSWSAEPTAPKPAPKPAVAASKKEAPANPPTAALPAAPTLATIKQDYQAQFDRRDWTAAIASAEKLVAAAREKAKTDPLALADALLLLGTAETGAKNAIAAEMHFGEALQLLEGRVGPTSGRLIEPLTGLGYVLAAQGKHETAIPLMERALVLERRNYGLFDTRQQPLLRNLAESQGTVGRIADGERQMLYLLSIGERNFGREDVRLVPILCIVGDWYVENGLVQAAREKFRIALGIAEDRLGKNSLAAVTPLRGLALSYTRELSLASLGPKVEDRDRDRSNNTGIGITNDARPISPRYLNPETERLLGKALKILDSNADRSAEVLVETLIQTGDVFQLRGMFDQALPYYRRAAVMVTADAKGQPGEGNLLSFPVQIYFPVPLLATRNLNRPPEEVVDRYVQVAFTVTAQGAVKDPQVTDKDATPRQISETLESIRLARYRPRFVNGEAVDTNDFIYRQVFKQRKDAE